MLSVLRTCSKYNSYMFNSINFTTFFILSPKQKVSCYIFFHFAIFVTRKQTKLPSNLRPTTRECMHLVRRGHFRSRDKNGVHTIVLKTPCYTLTTWLCFTELALLPMEVLHCGNGDFRLFCSCDLDLDLMIFIYELDPYSLKTCRMCKYMYDLPTLRLSKVII